jgi:hypothetical protein
MTCEVSPIGHQDDVTLDIAKTDAESLSPAEVRQCSVQDRKHASNVMYALLAAVPAVVLLTVVAVLSYGTTGGMNDNPAAALTGNHVGVATDIFIVDDTDATSSEHSRMLLAIPGKAPFFHKWFGSPSNKGFHHDGGQPMASKFAVNGTYTPDLQTDGCYEVHEWHPTGLWSQMSTSASVEITHSEGVERMLLDQSSNGGQWNYMASFNFKKKAVSLVLSNKDSRCNGGGPCFTTFDAFRFVYTAPSCSSNPQSVNGLKDNTFVFGNILLDVSDALSFIHDTTVVSALKEALASLAGVESSAVSISLSLAAGKRRLSVGPQLSESIVASYRISTAAHDQAAMWAETVAAAMDALTMAEVSDAISKAFTAAGIGYKVQVQGMRASLDSQASQAPHSDSSNSEIQSKAPDAKETHESSNSAESDKPSCMPATIINDFDSHLVTSIIGQGAIDIPEQGLEAFRPGRIGVSPFFHDWFGDIFKKDFHHDAHMNKGLVAVNYTSPLPKAGCYLLQEWHLGGNKYCVNYMPRRVPFHVHGIDGIKTTYADQSTDGGQWNSLGLFEFSTSATVVMSNAGTDNCLYRGACYTVFDSLRLIHVGDQCKDVDGGEDSLNSLSDLACTESNSLAQLRHAPGQNVAEPSTAESSSVKLLEVTSPNERTIARAGGDLDIQWTTEGIAAGTDMKISFLYDDEVLFATNHHMSAAASGQHMRIPPADFIRKYSHVATSGSSKFRIRIDMQHVAVELSNGWSNQLYAYSPFFTVDMK